MCACVLICVSVLCMCVPHTWTYIHAGWMCICVYMREDVCRRGWMYVWGVGGYLLVRVDFFWYLCGFGRIRVDTCVGVRSCVCPVCICVYVCGRVYVCVCDVGGYSCICVGACGCVCVCVCRCMYVCLTLTDMHPHTATLGLCDDLFGFQWVRPDTYGHEWMCVDVCGYMWMCVGPYM